jgi:hypothetical protein
VFHPATVILKNELFINEGFSRGSKSIFPRFLNFFRNFDTRFPEKEMRSMDKMNKYEQNNHKARGADGRERRTKPHFRARGGRYGRTPNPRAKTSAVQILTISNVPSDVLDAIDELAAGQDRSRSSFVRRELQRIVAGYRAKAA